MERGKRIAAVNGEILLPEVIIQHIQSFLSRKEAAQTTVLSKSWYSAWSTRPNIDFDQRNFQRNGGDEDPDTLIPDRFSEFARKTMQRYEELNLKIESFRLCMENAEGDSCLLAEELIVKAMKRGATDVNIELMSPTATFVLPHEVLGSENLVRLSVNGCKIDLGADGKVNCSSLKSLDLCKVYVQGDIIWDIISSCPLIEKLLFDECKFLYEDQRFGFATTRTRLLELGPFGFGKQNAEAFVDDRSNLYGFPKLTYLMLKYVKIDPLFFRGFSSKFPCLKDMYLDQCLSSKKIQICSRTLECISIEQIVMLRAYIDVPSLLKLTLSSHHLPSLTFGTASREWESDMSVGCSRGLNHAWFRQFKKFLTKLSPSKTSLSLFHIPNWMDGFDYAGNIRSGPVVENFTINTAPLECSSFWDGLFWSCRPKFITTSWSSKYQLKALEVCCRRLTQLNENCYIPNKSMFGQSDLEEVIVELFDKTVAAWQPVPWKTLLDASTITGTEQKVRIHLRWGR